MDECKNVSFLFPSLSYFDLVQGIDTVFRNAVIYVYTVHERGEKGNCLLGPRSGNLADHLPNFARQESDMVLWLVIKVIITVAPEGTATIVTSTEANLNRKVRDATRLTVLWKKGRRNTPENNLNPDHFLLFSLSVSYAASNCRPPETAPMTHHSRHTRLGRQN